MFKEITIIIVIIILVITANIITQNNVNKSLEMVSTELKYLRKEIIKEEVNRQKAEESIQKIETIWDEQYKKMAYYVEHNELEKVETEITKLKADVEVKNYSFAVENLDNCIFVLNHIKDKSALKIVNIF